MAFTDLTKAFDSVNHQALWLVLAKVGCPEKYIRVLWLLRDSMSTTVLSGSRDETELFRMDTGVMQPPPKSSTPSYSQTFPLITPDWKMRTNSHILSSNAVTDDEICHHLSCASSAFLKLKKRVFKNHNLQAKTKVLVYKAVVLPTLLYVFCICFCQKLGPHTVGTWKRLRHTVRDASERSSG